MKRVPPMDDFKEAIFIFDNKGRRSYTRLTKEERGGGRRNKSRGKKAK